LDHPAVEVNPYVAIGHRCGRECKLSCHATAAAAEVEHERILLGGDSRKDGLACRLVERFRICGAHELAHLRARQRQSGA
jgi:hypothetical protein